jgi:AcrR family transcriptional regulator
LLHLAQNYDYTMPVQKITKEEILVKSADVFRVKGYHNTSMQDLAEVCGLLKGSLYYHFPSKEMLMKDLLVSIHEFMTTQIFPIAKDETLSPEERMEKLLKKMGKLTLEREGGCLVGNTTLETVGVVPEFKEVLQAIMNDWTSALKDIFVTRKSTEQSIRLAQLTIMEFEGAIMFSKLYNDKQFLYDAFARTMMKLN